MRRAKWGVGAVVVVGIAWLLSNFFNMGGLGTGEGTRIGLPVAPTTPIAPTTPEEPPAQSEPAEETATVGTEAAKDAIGAGGVVQVLIDDRTYFLRRGGREQGEWVPADLDAISVYARQAAGDEAGVRVRVWRKPSAKALAEEELTAALQAVGLGGGAIDMPSKFVE